MNVNQVSKGLEQAFFNENHRIVFWYDADKDFKTELNEVSLPGVSVIDMENESALAVKIKLEIEDTEGKYLLYFPTAEPDIEKDWLLDIKLYSRSFYADRTSIIFNELGLHQQSLRDHLAQREGFLGSNTRIERLKKWVQPDSDEADLDLAMITSVVHADNCDLAHILFALAREMVDEDTGLESNPASIDELERFGLIPSLVSALKIEVGYPASQEELKGEAAFKLGHFLIRLLSTGFCESVGDVPEWASDLAIPSANARATSRALLSRWRDSSRYYKVLDVISDWVASALTIENRLGDFSLEQLAQVATFESVEKRIIVEIAGAIPLANTGDLSHFSGIISDRQNGHWASRLKDDDLRRLYATVYKALAAAVSLYGFRQTHSSGFHFPSTDALYKAYESDLYQFDLAYRHYCTAALSTQVEVLKPLTAEVEQCYSNWYIDNLAKNWGDCIEGESRLSDWNVPDIPNQQDFYRQYVEPIVEGNRSKRLVVIVSDAFRYEAATELRDRINQKRYNEASLSSQLGVVPSYTTLGMASLLPHSTLEYREGVSDDVFVDGRSTKGTENRNKILGAHNGMAVTAELVKSWSRDEGRNALKDQHLMYVYHNVVDARGDTSSTESETFMAVEHAIEELAELSRKILSRFNISTVIITADHGFLFQQSKLQAADKTSLADKPENALKNKKRYVIGHGLPEVKDVWCGSTKDTAGTTSDTEFWVPRGANRFHFVGGARFVHGGAMPQEVVVPVLTINQLRGNKAKERTKRKVSVISAKPSLKMVNNIQRFDLMQTEAISDNLLPVTLTVAIYFEGEPVSSEETVTFDCATDSAQERVKHVRLSLAGTDFNRNKDYFLLLRDKDLQTEISRYKVTIDLAFTDDFF